MKILGIHGDFHNPQKQVFESNASIVIDGEIMVAVSEERLTRKKLDGTFPWLAIDECLRIANLSIEEIDEVVVSSLSPKKNAMRYLKCTLSTFLDTGVLVRNKDKISVNLRPLIKGMFKSGGKGFSLKGREHVSFPIKYYDHHYAHAAGAFYCSPFDDALVITLDGGGNGLDGGAYIGNGTSLKRFLEVPHFQSPGTMYSAITYDLGFKRHRHEGKITGLAAYGKPQRDEMGLKNLLRYDVNKKRFVSKAIAKQSKDLYSKSDFFYPLLEKFSKEDVSATVQDIFEKEILAFIDDARAVAKKNGIPVANICLAGGCFANVKLNQRILALGFDNIFVFPAMGDGGLAAGAALLRYYEEKGAKRCSTVQDVYLGADFSDAQILKAIEDSGLAYEKPESIEKRAAELLADSKVVARFNGKMEYGPRALGNRSIMGAPFDKTINDWLNKKLNRTEFMPFAPSIIEEAASDYFVDYDPKHAAADFMTITYDVKPEMAGKIPAVVHIDNTARPQVVKSKVNKSYHKIIQEFGKLSGVPIVLNTSFNIHEEPIVCTPEEAIRGFLMAKLDYLAIGPYLVPLPEDN